MAATAWKDSIKRTKQLTVFPHANVSNGPWNRIFLRALLEFNRLSTAQQLGVTLVPSSTAPSVDGEDGANIQFETASVTAQGKAFGTPFSKPFSGTATHGLTMTFSEGFGNTNFRLVKALIFVPRTPTVLGLSVRGPARQREVGDGVKLMVALHEFVHAVSGLENADHSPESAPDIFVGPPVASPQLVPGVKPDDDRVVVGAFPNFTRFPPFSLSPTTAARIKAVWS